MCRYIHMVVWSVHETTLNDAATAVRLRGLCAAAASTATATADDDDGGAMNRNIVI